MESRVLNYDVAIVGQGIAGTLLSWFLYKLGKKVLIIDDNFNGAASKVAAGIVNPITGKNFVQSWRISEFLPVAIQTYNELSDFLDIKTYSKTNIIRSLYNIEDENSWQAKAIDPQSELYIKSTPDFSEFSGKVDHQFAYGELQGTFTVNMFEIIEQFRDKWDKNGSYLKEKFDYFQLNIGENGFYYQEHMFDSIVFCEGFKATYNPFFPEIGMAPSKGEVLIIKIPGAPFKKMYKDKIFIVHQSDELYWLGSGYEWDTLDENPTKQKYEMLLYEAKRILKIPFEVIDHRAAIRPTMHNRRPILKVHHNIPGMYLFNGLGTKGASIGPYLARQFARFIDKGNPDDLVIS